jgi:hypothetical protein
MVRNGFWVWYKIAILWYEMVNYGTKWLWCKIHMVRNGFNKCKAQAEKDTEYEKKVPTTDFSVQDQVP